MNQKSKNVPAVVVPAIAVPADKSIFLNRELSLLEFNKRVLAQAELPGIPLLERLKFLCIVSSNLDELFEVRIASLLANADTPDAMEASGLGKSLAVASEVCHELIRRQYQILNESILPSLAEHNIHLLQHETRNEAQRAWIKNYFDTEIRPILTPIGLDPSHPFPQVLNKSLNFIVELSGKHVFGRETTIAIVKAPRVLPRVIRLPDALSGSGDISFVLLSSIIHAHIDELFTEREILSYSQFRVTRNSDMWVDEEEVKNLRQALQSELQSRQFGVGVRLEVAANCPEPLSQFLLNQFNIAPNRLYAVDGPVNLARLGEISDQLNAPALKFTPFVQALPAGLPADNIFQKLRKKDILLHHPYQSFAPVVDFIRAAAIDPGVIAIRQTIYRTGMNSDLMEALISAARRGKEVTVVVELMARFDEEANINWAMKLEQAGAQVVYGIMGIKTHAKLALVIRREADDALNGATRLHYYAHLGTGNYHPTTTRFYTDFGLMTANQAIAIEVNEIFMHLASLTKPKKLEHLWLAPFSLQKEIIKAIRREADAAKAGRPAHIIAKMNALLDESVIRALYEASQCGVSIDLIVRGACALKPGVPGLSENIRVRSIVGRFLEHTRIYHFYHDGDNSVYLSSADWMNRNLFRRIEVAFPVLDRKLKTRVIQEGLKPYLKDTVNAWELQPDGSWKRKLPRRSARPFCAQEYLMQKLGGTTAS